MIFIQVSVALTPLMTQMASILTILRIQVVKCNQMTWYNLVPILDPFGSTYRSKRDDTAVGKVTHSLLCTQLEPAISHAIRSHLRRCLSGSLCCTRLGPSPLPLPRLSIVRREQSVRFGGELMNLDVQFILSISPCCSVLRFKTVFCHPGVLFNEMSFIL